MRVGLGEGQEKKGGGASQRRMKVKEGRVLGSTGTFAEQSVCFADSGSNAWMLFFSFLFSPTMIIIIIIIIIDLCSSENLLLKKKKFSFDQNYIVSLLTISGRRQEPEAPVLKCTSISAEDRFVKPSFSPYNIYKYILRTGRPKRI